MHSFSDFLTYASDAWDATHSHGDRIHRSIMRGLLVLFFLVGPLSILFAYIAAHGFETARILIVILMFVTSFATLRALSSIRKIAAVYGAGWAIGIPASGTGQEFAAKSLKAYGNAIGFTLLVSCLFQLFLFHFPQVVSNASGAFGVLATSYALMLVTTFAYLRGMITEGPWHKYVIGILVLVLAMDMFLGLPKAAPEASRQPTIGTQLAALNLARQNQGMQSDCIDWFKEILNGYDNVEGRLIQDGDLAAGQQDGHCSQASLSAIKKALSGDQASVSGSQIPTIGGEPITVIHFDLMDTSTWGPALAKFGVLHIIGLGIIALFGIWVVKNNKGTTTTTKAATSTGNGWKMLAVIMIIGGAGYYAWNNTRLPQMVKGGMVGASREMTRAETPVWNKLLTRDFVKAHGTKAFALGSEYDVVLDDNGRISLQQNGNEVYAMGQQDPCSDPIPTQFEGGKHTLATCSGKWKAGGSSYGTSYGTWVGKLNATHNGMIRVAYLSYSADPNRAPVEVWFR